MRLCAQELERGAAAPADAAAVVAHTGGLASGHYVGYMSLPGSGGGSWRAVGDVTASVPRENVKLAFFCDSVAPMFM